MGTNLICTKLSVVCCMLLSIYNIIVRTCNKLIKYQFFYCVLKKNMYYNYRDSIFTILRTSLSLSP